jgi:SARP family transcriptional regulator, regulator of embCAB operon
LRYEILGQLRIADGGDYSFISARKVEAVLAVLLIRSDQVVTPEQFMTEIWGDRPPRRATAALHVYVSHVRKALQRPGRSDNPVVTRPPGYLLNKGYDEFDYDIFLGLMTQGRSCLRSGQYEEASEFLEKALGQWHGPVLNDSLGGPIIRGFISRLGEERLECLEMLGDALLELGRHRELVGRLYSLTAENPFYEAFYRQLMLALYRSNRRADALRVYQTARRTMKEELGIEPCRALRDVHRTILAADTGPVPGTFKLARASG